jgi:hypothetical protein
MVNSELKAVMALATTMLIPWTAQADAPGTPGSANSQNTSSFLPGEKVKEGLLPAGYNETASYSCRDPWKLFLTGDYIYWDWQQEMMEIGTLITPTAFGAASFLNGSGDVVLETPGYASGFQLGLGCDLRGMDDWQVYSEYTWYKNTSDTRTITTGSDILAVSPTLVQYVDGANPGVLLSSNLATSAHMSYNCVDLLMQRPFYFGRKLTANFVAGLEALWISQKTTANGSDLSFVEANSLTEDTLRGSFSSYSKQKSWGLGPKFGFSSSWLLGYGLKIMGSASLNLLYTSYIKLTTSTRGVISNINLANLVITQSKNYNTVNPVGEAYLGLGWGTYFCDNSFHLDFTAGYDFKVFWGQNVINSLVNSNGSPGSMSLRGLNIQVRFDF